MKTISEFVKENQITFSCKRAKSNPNVSDGAFGEGAMHWLCTLQCSGKRFNVPK